MAGRHLASQVPDPGVSLSLSGHLSLLLRWACLCFPGELGLSHHPIPQAWDPDVLSTYQQAAGVLEFGLVQHPPVTQILQLICLPCWSEAKKVLEEMLTFWYPSLQVLWEKGSECHVHLSNGPDGPHLADEEEPIKFHSRGAGS